MTGMPGDASSDDQPQSNDPTNQTTAGVFTGAALATIVLAVLQFFQPTISSSSWTPWIRAALAVAVLTLAIVAVVLVAKLA
ncbi:hypothetical protein M8542_36580 [Amycolatopsis sp. OK19-0408]|uniref:Uncharacterized protein n=1 Tax=Amycolatopsis iheyensis TaxID=2945988 RepID=A0A9X2NJ15_9PSEU|nr:hypothetical protein [Amycolatopsis iheyensis]MCR6488361.1 hypothetical protein [Amycolatopsis iheyensis]